MVNWYSAGAVAACMVASLAHATPDFWAAAIAPAEDHGSVVLSPDISVANCQLSYSFTSNGGSVVDAFIFPLGALDTAATRAQSAAPSQFGITFVLQQGQSGETTKTLANGTTRTRLAFYGSFFPEQMSSDEAALLALGALLQTAQSCGAGS